MNSSPSVFDLCAPKRDCARGTFWPVLGRQWQSTFRRKVEMKNKRQSRSSLRDINKRYGRTIRFPSRRKRTHHSHRSAAPHSSGKTEKAGSATRRNRLVFWLVVVLALVLGIISHVQP